MYFFIQQNRRLNANIASGHPSTSVGTQTGALAEEKFALWRSLAGDLRLITGTRQVPQNFARDLRHLDHTSSREVHKVAIIYVAKGQEVSAVFFFFTCPITLDIRESQLRSAFNLS